MKQKQDINVMPKIELHLHLDGCLQVASAYEMIKETEYAKELRSLYFEELHKKMVVGKNLDSQKELLSYFQVPTMVLQNKKNLTRAVKELCIQKAKDNVCYCEIRFAPFLHTSAGLSVEEVIDAVLEGKCEGERVSGIEASLIAVALRSSEEKENIALLKKILPYKTEGLVAIDCAGIEEDFSIMKQERFFNKAKEMGFFTTFHCGEISESLEELKEAVFQIKPDRVAHGAIAINDISFCEFLKKEKIMLDLCPTSNVQAGLYPSIKCFPADKLYQMGVPISISTDDSVLSDITLSKELMKLSRYTNLTMSDLYKINLCALGHSFATKKQKEKIREKIKEWETKRKEEEK